MKRKVTTALVFVMTVNGLMAIPQTALAQPTLGHDIPTEWVSHSDKGMDEKVRVIVQLGPRTNRDRVEAQFRAYDGVKIRKQYDVVFNGFSAEVPFSYIPVLRQIPGVENLTQSTTYHETMATSGALTQALEAAGEYGNKGEGIVVSIIDSGIDVEHPAFASLADPERAKIKEVHPYGEGTDNLDTRFNLKIPYGYNFADDSYYVKGLESNHGIHVAGIVGANDTEEKVSSKTGVSGVANQVQLLAMKVFSNDPEGGGAHDDDIIAAIESSIEHGADIINLSLGSESGFKNDNNPMQRAINAATAKGILVVAAGGNETAAFADTTDGAVSNLFNRHDVGLIGSPSTASTALSVASFENTNRFVYHLSFDVDGTSHGIAYDHSQGELPQGKVKFVDVGLGKEDDYTEDIKTALQGNIALIKRGDITFVEKLQRAQKNGAIGMVVYNHTPKEKIGMSLGGTDKNFFAASITLEEGEEILAGLQASPELQFEFDPSPKHVDNEDKDQMSSFTSWGTTSSLDFKPEITGVGGQVYSTDNDGKYTMMSGTSMASPHVAGVSAIVMSQIQKDLPGLTDYPGFIKKTMMNTAKTIVVPGSDLPFSVRRQGAGLIQTSNAIKNRVLATMGDENGPSCGELRSFTGSKQFDVFLKNYGTKSLTFTVDPGKVYSTFTEDDVLKEKVSTATITTDASEVTLAPGEGKRLTFTVDASSVTDEFVEGFVEFTSQDSEQPNIHFAFMGFAGDWNKESIFDVLDVTENADQPLFGDTKLISMIKDPLNIFDEGKIFTLGVPFGEEDPNVKPTAAHVAFSPNGDGFADVILPQIGMLRSAQHMQINILDANKNLIKHVYELEGVRRQSLKGYIDRVNKGLLFTVYPYAEGMWDGMVYDQKTGENKVVEDGQYYMQILARLGDGYEYQELLFPVKIDKKQPKIEVVQSDGKNYSLVPEGRVITFKVKDEGAVGSVYAKVNGERFEAEAVDGEDNTYSVTIPYGTHTKDTVVLVANDMALNESRVTLDDIAGNSLKINDWKSFQMTKINSFMGESVTGSTELAETAKISFIYISQTDENVVFTGRDNRVSGGRFMFAALPTPDEGKYFAVAVEKNAAGDVIRTTDLGEYVYDYHAPKIVFDNVEKITEESEQKRPLERKSYKNYVEYAVHLNADGTATFSGTVSDNVFSPEELTVTIGSRENKVTPNPDGTFKYTLKTPSAHFDFVNVYQPVEVGYVEEESSTIAGLDLAVGTPDKTKKKLERTYVVSKYLPYEGEVASKEFALSVNRSFILGKDSLEDGALSRVVERDGKYYFTLDGYTTQPDSQVLVNRVASNTNTTTDGGTHFRSEIEIHEGSNSVNVRVNDAEGNMQADVKVRILFDLHLPSLTLTSPEDADIEAATITNDEGEQEDVLYLDVFEDEVTFKGTVSDSGFDYTLKLNDEYLASHSGEDGIAGNTPYGNNEKEFSKTLQVEDGDVLSLFIGDSHGNEQTQKYIVRKLEKPKLKVLNKCAEGTLTGVSVKIFDKDNASVTEFVSAEEFNETELMPGTYTYHEDATVEGYKPVADFEFTVAKDGTITFADGIEGVAVNEGVLEVTSPDMERIPVVVAQDTELEGYTTEGFDVSFTLGEGGKKVEPKVETEVTLTMTKAKLEGLKLFNVVEGQDPVEVAFTQGDAEGEIKFMTAKSGLFVLANKIPDPVAKVESEEKQVDGYVTEGHRVVFTLGEDGEQTTPADEQDVVLPLNKVKAEGLKVFRVTDTGELEEVENFTVEGDTVKFKTNKAALYLCANMLPEPVAKVTDEDKEVEGYVTEGHRVVFTSGPDGEEVVPTEDQEVVLPLGKLSAEGLKVFRVTDTGDLEEVENFTVEGDSVKFMTKKAAFYLCANTLPQPKPQPVPETGSTGGEGSETTPGTTDGASTGATDNTGAVTPGTETTTTPGAGTTTPGTETTTTPGAGTTTPDAGSTTTPGAGTNTTPGAGTTDSGTTTAPVSPTTSGSAGSSVAGSVSGSVHVTTPSKSATSGVSTVGSSNTSADKTNTVKPGKSTQKSEEAKSDVSSDQAAQAKAEDTSSAGSAQATSRKPKSMPSIGSGIVAGQSTDAASETEKTEAESQKAEEKSESKKSSETVALSKSATPEEHQAEDNSSLLYAIVAGVAAVLAGLFFFIAKRKKNNDK